MESIWRETSVKPDLEMSFEKPDAKSINEGQPQSILNADAIVIGGGMAGILTAWMLESKGVRTIVLEADTVGSGQTGGTTAKVTAQHDLIYDRLMDTVGRELAGQYAHANSAAIDSYKGLIDTLHISCDWEDSDAYLYSTGEAAVLQREADAARELGLPAEYTQQTDLPFTVAGAVRFRGQAHFHPLKFLYALAASLRIYEHTPVLKVEGNEVLTARGRFHGAHIIFATHYPFMNRPGYYFMRMHQERSYALAVRGARLLNGMYLSVDHGGLSFRNYEDMLIIGGGSHRTGENSGGGQYEQLRRWAREFWPGCTEAACWSAQDCMTLDHIPYIGRFSRKYPDWYVATGFKKWGMTSAMVSAQLISDAIVGKDNPDRHVFSPQRRTWAASSKNFIKDGWHSARHLTRYYLTRPGQDIQGLAAGHGGIVKYDGHKVGAYRDEDGSLYVVSVRCPHLGCQLEWNPEEKSWDCPCHGSRYDHTGLLLNNPAQKEDIHHEKD